MINVNPSRILTSFETPIGNFVISYYSLVYIFGFLAVLVTLLHASKKKKISMSKDQIYEIMAFEILGVIIGARLFNILFWSWDYFKANPLKVFAIWEGGLAFHGGFVGAVVVALVYFHYKKISFLELADLTVIPVTFFLALGRIANFLNQEILGKVTDLSWCVSFAVAEGCRHPIQIYAAFGRFALFGFLLFLYKKNLRKGFVFWSFILLISLGRFTLDFLRVGETYAGLLAGQWLSLILIIHGLFILTTYYKKDLTELIRYFY